MSLTWSTPESPVSPWGSQQYGSITLSSLDEQLRCFLFTRSAMKDLFRYLLVLVLGGRPTRPRDHPCISQYGWLCYTLGFPRNLALHRLNRSFSKSLTFSHSLLCPFKAPWLCLHCDLNYALKRPYYSWKGCSPIVMTLSSLLRIVPRLTPTATRGTSRAVSSTTNTPNTIKSLDSILIANRGEIALYVGHWIMCNFWC